MISVIICIRELSKKNRIVSNIEKTIGTFNEIIFIDNSKNKYNIFEAYNLGIEKSNGDILCFVHDDVIFHTQDWGKNVEKHLSISNVGMIGVAGPTYISKFPSIWWSIGLKNPNVIRQYNIDSDREKLKDSHTTNINPFNETASDVVALDGVFFCIKKKIFLDYNIKFDNSYKGFHFYDIDISLQILKKQYRILCVYDILIEHVSVSNINKTWLKASKLFYKKWKNQLPIMSVNYKKSVIQEMDKSCIKVMNNIIISNGISLFRYYSFVYLIKIIVFRIIKK